MRRGSLSSQRPSAAKEKESRDRMKDLYSTLATLLQLQPHLFFLRLIRVLLAPIHPCLPVTYIMYIIKTIDNTAGENAVAVPTGTSDKGTETTEGTSRMVKESKKKLEESLNGKSSNMFK
ncbi:hypothetical protein Tco_0784730 [Tanacetum coccineum]